MSRNKKLTLAIALIATLMSTVTAQAGLRRTCRPACQQACAPRPSCCDAQYSCCSRPPCAVAGPCVYAPSLACTVNVEVYFNGGTVCVRGKVGCTGAECNFDVCLGQGEFTVDCGDMQVKLRPSGGQVCIKARVKVFGGWTPWTDLGCYP